jgi:hypothetical protein
VPATYTVLNTNDSGPDSLRQAILDANANPGADTIAFNIPGDGVHTICPASSLPSLAGPMTIDGYSQPDSSWNTLPDGDNAVLTIELDGHLAGSGGIGLTVGQDCTVQGLVINRFDSYGIVVQGSGTIVRGNFIGTNSTGSVGAGNDIGIYVGGIQDVIGGLTPADRNVISGNAVQNVGVIVTDVKIQGNLIGTDRTGTSVVSPPQGGLTAYGIFVYDRNDLLIGGTATGARNVIAGANLGIYMASANYCTVQGNYIGTDSTGDQPLPIGDGIRIIDSHDNLIGGTTSSARNVVANTDILFQGNTYNNAVQGNYIGLNAAGTERRHGLDYYSAIELGNDSGPPTDGVHDNLIGGTAPGAGNVIASGVVINNGAHYNTVQGNLIGTDATGHVAVGAGEYTGVVMVNGAHDNLVGGTDAGARNLISGNFLGRNIQAVFIDETSYGNTIQGNLIGTDISGVAPLGNYNGVVIYGSNNTIGGTAPGAGNVIAFNSNGGVKVRYGGTGNVIRGNSIHDNDGLGIRLTEGANNGQPAPALYLFEAGATTHVGGLLNSTPNTTFLLDFYANTEADPSGYGEGERWLGSATVTTDAAGNASFNVLVPGATGTGEFLTATATDAAGNTSEFSGAIAVAPPPNRPPADVWLSLNAGTINEGDTATLTGSFTDPDAGDMHTVTINWGPGETPTTLTLGAGVLMFNATHPYLDDNPTATSSDLYAIGVTVTDNNGATGTGGIQLTVANAAPVVGAITAPVAPVQVGTAITVSAGFTDVGTLDTHAATWDWGDGSTSAGAVTESGGSGSVGGSHAYTAAGVYTVRLTVTDDDGGAGSAEFRYVVAYDPSAGFVTGGGWIDSPAGAYAANPSLSGKANFGFESRYQNGSGVPTGNTEFQFKVGNFTFKSTALDWLVVSGAKARYRGTGTVNGVGSYGFELTAWDGQVNGGGGVDRFRIKIWDQNQGNGVVYDNMMGADDGADPTTAVGGGSVVIHK